MQVLWALDQEIVVDPVGEAAVPLVLDPDVLDVLVCLVGFQESVHLLHALEVEFLCIMVCTFWKLGLLKMMTPDRLFLMP